MTTITYSEPVGGFPVGAVLRVAGSTNGPYVVRRIDAPDTITVAPWTWIARVISWNPCNDLDLAVGVFE